MVSQSYELCVLWFLETKSLLHMPKKSNIPKNDWGKRAPNSLETCHRFFTKPKGGSTPIIGPHVAMGVRHLVRVLRSSVQLVYVATRRSCFCSCGGGTRKRNASRFQIAVPLAWRPLTAVLTKLRSNFRYMIHKEMNKDMKEKKHDHSKVHRLLVIFVRTSSFGPSSTHGS